VVKGRFAHISTAASTQAPVVDAQNGQELAAINPAMAKIGGVVAL
jgi:hypothetical protein